MSPDQPVISVIIPAHNEEGYIQAAVQSVVDQTYPADRLECIVVDNASSDDTVSTALNFAGRHQTICLRIASEPRLGPGWAKNGGVEAAVGQILIFLDADSRMAPTLAAAVAGQYQAGNVVGSIRVAGDGSWIDRGFFDLMELGKTRFGIRAQMLYCDRLLFQELGGFEGGLKLGEDVDFLDRARRHLRPKGERVIHVTSSHIVTSSRRLSADHHLGMVKTFGRWLLAFFGVGRRQNY